jgi:hypothetical protein
MAIDQNSREVQEPGFSFGVRELQRAAQAEPLSLKVVEPAKPKAVNLNQGSDPYNSSGSFDRKKNWTRVGKR